MMMMITIVSMLMPISLMIVHCSLCCLSLLSLTLLMIPSGFAHDWQAYNSGYQGDQPYNYDEGRDIGLNITQILDSFFSSGYDKRVRPNYGGPPVKVGVTMHILTISSVSEVQMDFTTDFYFRQIWKDPRLSFKARPGISQIPVGAEVADKIWVPDTFFANEKQAYFHEATTKNTFLRISHDGQVFRSIRLTVTASCPMNLQYFPMDRQKCNIEIESYGYSMTDIIYNWVDENAVRIDSNLMLPQFSIASKRQSWKYVHLSTGNYSRLMCEIQLIRSMGYYMIQIYVPASLIVIISWVSFWLHRNATPARVHLGVITVLTMTTLMSSTNSQLPKISYVKSIDVFLGTCFVMVFAALLEYAAVGYIGKRISMRKNRFQQLAKAAEEKRRKLVEAAAAAAAAAAGCTTAAEAIHHSSGDQSISLSGAGGHHTNNFNVTNANTTTTTTTNNNNTSNNISNNNSVNINNNNNNNMLTSTNAPTTVSIVPSSVTGTVGVGASTSTASSFQHLQQQQQQQQQLLLHHHHHQQTGQNPVDSALHGSSLISNSVCSASANVGVNSVPKHQQHQHQQHQQQHSHQHHRSQFQHQQSIGTLTSVSNLGGGLSVPSGLVTYDSGGLVSGGSGSLMMNNPGELINCGGHGGSMGSMPLGCSRDDQDETLITHVGHYATLRRPLLERGGSVGSTCRALASGQQQGGGGNVGGGMGASQGVPASSQKQFLTHRPQVLDLDEFVIHKNLVFSFSFLF
ncbi:gamma-aminobutyric acid receptor subunit alpha-4-like isoform X2 [Panonychus citri]|uniref:gamma-aminobutyric acid receptor subunit alpha-4-like isoform X2 n=1 Tax=Panonychus citri TaxID=50023 RepID=UPI002307B218|nr:gamma-aminobutyric acid receptor subunit alpha-4-like isoform X2 [Panonychus citri]